jgi:hypothetical protein
MSNSKKTFFLFLASVLVLFSCKTTKHEMQYGSILDYTCIVEQKGKDIQHGKNIMNSRVAQIFADYAFGISYTLNSRIVKTYLKAEISQIGKESSQAVKKINGGTFLIETGRFRYNSQVIMNYRAKYNVQVTGSGDDFWKIYNKLISDAILSKIKVDSQGIVLPQGNMEVKLSDNGTISIAEEFVVFAL